jgi:hypothetical protein
MMRWCVGLIGVAAAGLLAGSAPAQAQMLRHWPKHVLWQTGLVRIGPGIRGCAIMNTHEQGDEGFALAIAMAPNGDTDNPEVVTKLMLMDKNYDDLRGNKFDLAVDGQYLASANIDSRNPNGEIKSITAVIDPKKFDRLVFPALRSGNALKVSTSTAVYTFGLNGFDSAWNDFLQCTETAYPSTQGSDEGQN